MALTIEQQKALAIAQAKRKRAQAQQPTTTPDRRQFLKADTKGAPPIETAPKFTGSNPFAQRFGNIENIPEGVKDVAGEVGRQAGLTGRAVIEGAAALPAMAANVVGGLANEGLDLVDRLRGRDLSDLVTGEGEKFRFPDQAALLSGLLTQMGVPEPEGVVEEIVQRASQGLVNVAGGVGVGQALAKSASPVASGVGQTIAAQPVAQAVGAATGPAAGETARQLGAGPVVQGVAELAGGVLPAIKGGKAPLSQRSPTTAAEEAALGRARTAQVGLEEATGVKVPVFEAQASGTPSKLLEQRFLQQIDPTSQQALSDLSKQNDKAFNATVNLLESISPEEAIDTAGGVVRSASKAAIAARRTTQKEASSPIYKQAYRRQREGKVPLLDMSEFSKKYKNIAKQYTPTAPGKKDEVADSLRDIVSRVEGANGDLRQLHNVKTHIDRLLENAGTDSLARTSKRFISEVKKDLVSQLTEKSPSYRAARDEFIRTQGPIDELVNMSIGKAASLADDKLDNAAAIFFDAKASPSSIAKARGIIQKEDPDAWNQIIRRELHNRTAAIRDQIEDQGIDSVSNLPAELRRAIFGGKNSNKRRLLMQAVDKDTAKNLNWLDTVLSMTASGRAAGSPTSPFNVIKERLMGNLALAKKFASAPLGTIAEKGNESVFNRNARALFEAAYNPDYLDEMAKIRALGPNSPEAGKLLNTLLNNEIRRSELEQSISEEQPAEEDK